LPLLGFEDWRSAVTITLNSKLILQKTYANLVERVEYLAVFAERFQAIFKIGQDMLFQKLLDADSRQDLASIPELHKELHDSVRRIIPTMTEFQNTLYPREEA
jgi:hypothetical protein